MPTPCFLQDPTSVELTKKEIAFAIKRLGGKKGVRSFIRGETVIPLEEIVRCVSVDRKRTPWQALAATSRNVLVPSDTLRAVSRGEGKEAEVYFFLHCFMGIDHLKRECEERRSVLADFYSVAAVNEEDVAFADDYPNITCWKGPDGRWYFLTFDRHDGVRRVQVSCNEADLEGLPLWVGCIPLIMEIPLFPSLVTSSDPLDGR